MQLSFDVWHEIISYLQYREDGHTLRSLALTSKMSSNLALDIIWRHGENFLKIVSVINSFAALPGEPFLEYRPAWDEAVSAWVLHRPLSYAARLRALEYLARIRNLRVVQSWPASREHLLFSFLPTCLDSAQPLFPYLRQLEIHDDAHDVRSARIDCLTPVISPALKTLVIYAERFPEDKLMLPILELAKARGCDLEVFSYTRSFVQRAPEVLISFRTLKDVHISPGYSLQDESSIAVVKFLTSLPSLRSLSCNTSAFMRCATEETFYHTSLQRICIVSPSPPPWELFRRCIFPSVTEVRVETGIPPGFEHLDPSCPVFADLGTSCPNVQKLSLTVHPNFRDGGCPVFDLKQLAPVISYSTVQELYLRVANFELAPSDFRAISESCPNLHSFNIYSTTALDYTALPSLAAFSNHPRLSRLDLGIRPHYLLNNITEVPDMIAAHSPARSTRSDPCSLYFVTLGGPSVKEIPTTRAEKRLLVEYLLLAFPSLKIESENKYMWNMYADAMMFVELQKILLELREERGEPVEIPRLPLRRLFSA